MNLTKVIQECPVLQGTFVQDLFEAVQDGQTSFPDDPVVKGERVLGKLNEMEGALYFLQEKYEKIEEEIRDRVYGQDPLIEQTEISALTARLASCKFRFEAANTMMWENIVSRLDNRYAPIVNLLAIRANGQIVLSPDADGCNCDPSKKLLALALMGAFAPDC